MDNELFELAVEAALKIPPKDVIGTKSEHYVHSALKYLFQPIGELHEQKIDGFICDATDAEHNEIFEIQTKAFNRLKKKLSVLLPSHPVTVIYPVTVQKRIITVYEKSGEATVRLSPKKQTFDDIFAELCKIRELVASENLKIKLALIKVDERRAFGCEKSERRAYQKPLSVTRIPMELIEIKSLTYPNDYVSLLPYSLPDGFCSAELAKELGISKRNASYLLLLLTELKIVHRISKTKKGFLYERANP